MNIVIPIPIKGYNAGANIDDTPIDTSGDMNNVRPIDGLEQRLRIGQRPGKAKVYSEQIASATAPIVWLGSVSVVDYLGND